MSPSKPYEVKLERIYEGPMDLLIHLIRKNEVDIYDIPIALITRQYLEYLEWMKSMNIDFAGDFLVMAATLAQIKSKMMLPMHESDQADQEDPRMEIARPLLEYLQIKTAAEDFAQRHLLGDTIFTRPPPQIDRRAEPAEEFIQVGLFELIDAFQHVLARVDSDQQVQIVADRVSIRQRITEIVAVLESEGAVTFEELLPPEALRRDIVLTLLAVLEMVRLTLVRVAQHVPSGIIRLFYL